MKYPFWKMHGAGNDFVLFDCTREEIVLSKESLAAIGKRKTGIGCDGFIFIRSSSSCDFQMQFFNPDGSEAEMCGNGARCVARLAHDLKIAGETMAFETGAGVISAEITGELVRLQMTMPTDWRIKRTLKLGGRTLDYGFVNSGVPHVVVEVEDLATTDVVDLGAGIRYHADFAPAGANANFIQVTGPHSICLRTYERGVEDETLACGTGMVASALVAARRQRVTPPVTLTCASGDQLQVDFKLTQDSVEALTLLGPACYVFQGDIDAPEPL